MPAHRRDELRAAHEDFARREFVLSVSAFRFFVGLDLEARRNQIRVALALAYLRVADAVELVGHRQQSLREKLYRLDVYGKLARLRHEQSAFDADEVAVVEKLKELP